jgi:hypothetical protein
MTADSHNPRRGSRDNGLRCAGYTAIADLDPRIVDALLTTLAEAGIAAYAEPTPGTTVGYMERVLPERPIDRLSVDSKLVTEAQAIVEREKESHEPERVADLDFDQAWQDVLTSLRAPAAAASPIHSWPVSEDVDEADRPQTEAELDLDELADDSEDVHFEPPPPPPLPRFRPVTLAAIFSILVGLLILATDLDGGSFTLLAILAIGGGVASLIYNMRQGPPTDSGWDDGAVV